MRAYDLKRGLNRVIFGSRTLMCLVVSIAVFLSHAFVFSCDLAAYEPFGYRRDTIIGDEVLDHTDRLTEVGGKAGARLRGSKELLIQGELVIQELDTATSRNGSAGRISILLSNDGLTEVIENPGFGLVYRKMAGGSITEYHEACGIAYKGSKAGLEKAAGDFVTDPVDYRRGEIIGRERLSGRETVVLEAKSKGGQRHVHWIDTELGIPLRSEIWRNDNRLVFLRYISNITVSEFPRGAGGETLGPGSGESAAEILAGSVEFRPGTLILGNGERYLNELLVRRLSIGAGFRVIPPGYLPEGFRFIGGRELSFSNRKLVQLIYENSDGGRISVFQEDIDGRILRPLIIRRRIGRIIGSLKEKDLTVSYSLKGRLLTIVIGNIDRTVADGISQSIRWDQTEP